MRSDYELDRISNSIKQLEREYEQLRHSIMRTKRDEQFEVERIRRDYSQQLNHMEERQQEILRTVAAKKNELERISQRKLEETGALPSRIASEREQRLRRIR